MVAQPYGVATRIGLLELVDPCLRDPLETTKTAATNPVA